MTAPMNTTDVLADFVSGITYESLPPELIARVKRQCLDLIGVAIAGSGQDAAVTTRSLIGPPGAESATVWGTDLHTTIPDAAFVNATAAHALDFDDMWLPGAHPSAPILPGAVAIAESRGLSGRELIAAMVAGYEIMGRLHSVVSGRFGWHPTGVFGSFGSVAACSRLLGLDPSRTAMAFGIASSMTGGIDGHSGTMTKPLHAGLAAHAGTRAALLADAGFTASDHVFDGKRSFFESFFPSVTPQNWRLTADLGVTYYLLNPGIGIKMYPAGYYMHQTFEAALQIVVDNALGPDDVESIRIGAPSTGFRFDRPFPKSSLDAKFSLQFMATAAVIFQRLSSDLFDDDIVSRDDVRSMLSRIQVYAEPNLPANPDIAQNPVTITTRNGDVFGATVSMPKSHWRYPLPRQAWIDKFRRNVGDLADPDALIDRIERLEEITDIREITRLLST